MVKEEEEKVTHSVHDGLDTTTRCAVVRLTRFVRWELAHTHNRTLTTVFDSERHFQIEFVQLNWEINYSSLTGASSQLPN